MNKKKHPERTKLCHCCGRNYVAEDKGMHWLCYHCYKSESRSGETELSIRKGYHKDPLQVHEENEYYEKFGAPWTC